MPTDLLDHIDLFRLDVGRRLDKKRQSAMVKYLGDIAWETEVWVADAPSHLIHFNGERFLGLMKWTR
jgi:hypothetical protein